MQKVKRRLFLTVIISILFVTGAIFANVFLTQNKAGVSNVRGEENQEDKPEAGDEKDEAKDNEEEKNSEIKDNKDKKDEVKTNKNKTSATGQKAEDNEDEVDEMDGNETDEADSESGDLQEEIQDLNKDIKKVESKISVLSANGADTSSLSASLSEVKDLVGQAEAKIATSVIGVDALLESADNKLGRLQRLVKMTLGDEDETDDDNDAMEEIQNLAKNIAKIEVKLNTASSNGTDVSALKTSLDSIKDLLSQAKEKATAGDLAGAEALTEVADKKMETLEHAMELALGDDDSEDGDEADEYKNEVALFVHNLGDISEMDSGIGQQVKVVAQAQNATSAKVENSIKEIDGRGGFVKFLIGPKYGSIADVQTAITENQTRIKVLNDLMVQVTDPVVKQVLQDQIKQFQQENTRLQAFITENESGVSLFGWLMKMFS